MADARLLNLGGCALPVDMEAIEALESLPVPADGVIQFDFAYRDIRFAAHYQHGNDESGGTLKLLGDAGPLPFTAESPAARSGLGHIVMEANDVLGPTFRFIQNRIALSTEVPVAAPVTATNIIAAIATALIPATPYLDLIAVYVCPPLASCKPGESALRPEWRRRKPAR